ncbi:MAG TPA: Stk1 family PASTA domain-containing Ser/Thr kinase [Solirubrobacterales bacterium]|jgi:serine/threonine-protein kinase|nr:Stk1 family PASTA domain-containing Ser/Thr kinase [Solirubrobacterales bacterium]
MKLEAKTLIAGRYRLLGKLGSGGMADVWCAEDTMLDRRVALKFLLDRFAQDEQFVERFRREASAAAGLQHPNVVGVFDRGTFDGSHYIAMEYVEGASLKELIERGLSVGEAVEIVRQVLAGVRYAHAHGIVHRDLKPQNVLVDAEGRAMVTDFGIARAGVSEITQTGSVLGTAQYLSPEQAQGLPVTASSDIYSIGVMLYEALTGRVPFEADSPVTVALKQVSERPHAPSELNPAVSRALDAVVLKALAKDPANRFASAEEFSRALDAAEADPSGAGLGDTASYAAVAAAAGTPPPGPPPEGPPERRGFFTPARLVVMALLLLALLGLLAFAATRSSTEHVLVPTVFGKSRVAAERILRDAGFVVATRSVSSNSKRGTVLKQDPPAGSRVDKGSVVTITVSLGPGTVPVPEVAGQTEKEALRTLKDQGLRPNERRRHSRSVKAGLAIGTIPAAGAELERGKPITLLVSTGAKLVQIPPVIGEQQDVADTQLRDAGLIPDFVERNSDAPPGEVILQHPPAGSTVKEHTRVTIVVSNGAGTAIVPNVVGESEEAAKADLRSNGLSARVAKRTTSDQGEDGQVLEQSPSAGTRLRRGEPVTIFVGKFKEPPTTTTTPTTTPTP